jgi:hypothetical protein
MKTEISKSDFAGLRTALSDKRLCRERLRRMVAAIPALLAYIAPP